MVFWCARLKRHNITGPNSRNATNISWTAQNQWKDMKGCADVMLCRMFQESSTNHKSSSSSTNALSSANLSLWLPLLPLTPLARMKGDQSSPRRSALIFETGLNEAHLDSSRGSKKNGFLRLFKSLSNAEECTASNLLYPWERVGNSFK